MSVLLGIPKAGKKPNIPGTTFYFQGVKPPFLSHSPWELIPVMNLEIQFLSANGNHCGPINTTLHDMLGNLSSTPEMLCSLAKVMSCFVPWLGCL